MSSDEVLCSLFFLVIATEMLGKKLGLKKSSHGHRAVFL